MNVKLVIAIPSLDMVHMDFALSLFGLGLDLSEPIPGVTHQFVPLNTKGSILPKSREKLVEAAINAKATHILFLDSDMVFPAETVRGLLSRNLAVVAANCPTKTFPSVPTARYHHSTDRAGIPVPVAGHGVQKVWRVGCGVMLVRLSVFALLPRPWFNTRWDPLANEHVGEDWYFCEQLEAAGIPIYVDNDLSPHIGHIGSYMFSEADMGQRVQLAAG